MKPLEGIKVLDLSWVYSGPFGTLLLTDMGAEVIKLEGPPFGDMTRIVPPLRNGWSGYFYMLNRGKKSISLDLKSDKGKELFFELIKNVDVVTENFKAGTLDNLGLGYEQAKKVNPNIIFASINGFGSSGPYSNLRCVDPVAQAMGGLMSLTGLPETPPLKTGPAIADALAGMNMVIGIIAALFKREKLGVGDKIEAAMMDSVFAVLEESVIRASMTGNALPARGNTDPLGAPWDAFLTRDGKWVMVCAIGGDKFYQIYKSIGRKDLAEKYTGDDEEAFEERSKNLHYLNEVFAQWSKEKTAEEIARFCEELSVSFGIVKDVNELLADPHLKDRNMVLDIKHPRLGDVKTFNTPIKFFESEAQVKEDENPSDPKLGEHTEEILSKILGLEKSELEQLKEQGVIWN